MDIDPANIVEVVLAKMGLHTTTTKLAKMHGDMGELRDDIRTLEGWVQDMVDNLKEWVTSAFTTQQGMIDDVEDKVDELKELQTNTRR